VTSLGLPTAHADRARSPVHFILLQNPFLHSLWQYPSRGSYIRSTSPHPTDHWRRGTHSACDRTVFGTGCLYDTIFFTATLACAFASLRRASTLHLILILQTLFTPLRTSGYDSAGRISEGAGLAKATVHLVHILLISCIS
jgi:hypothetical protein